MKIGFSPALGLLFRCPACAAGPDTRTFPFCAPCADSLVSAPPLNFHPSDAQPWNTRFKDHQIDRLRARYLMVEPGYSVLRRWKTSPSPALQQLLLHDFAPRFDDLARQADLIAPVPQTHRRAWRLGGSPARRLGTLLSQHANKPLLPVHAARPIHRLNAIAPTSQAKNPVETRLSAPPRFELLEPLPHSVRRILLVDDFMTTGQTLCAFARSLLLGALAQGHPQAANLRLDVVCLGLRLHRLNRGGGTVTVRQENQG